MNLNESGPAWMQGYNSPPLEAKQKYKPRRVNGGGRRNREQNFIHSDTELVLTFGKYKGKTLGEIRVNDPDYLNWILDNFDDDDSVRQAVVRMANRRAVTAILNAQHHHHHHHNNNNNNNNNIPRYIPQLTFMEKYFIPKIDRHDELDPSLYGSFVENLVKFTLGLKRFPEAEKVFQLDWDRSNAGSKQRNSNVPVKRIEWMLDSFNKPASEKTPLDICNLSFAHSVNLAGNNFNENGASQLFRHVQNSYDEFRDFANLLKTFNREFWLRASEQTTSVSVGALVGEIDAICDSAIIEIKCSKYDDETAYRKQLFTYACMHRLNYGPVIDQAYVFNFLTGKAFHMDLSELSFDLAVQHIRQLGSGICREHNMAFAEVQ